MKTRKIYKDKRVRFNYNLLERKKYIYKYILYLDSSDTNTKFLTFFYNSRKNSNLYSTKIKNICLYSGRSRGVLSKYKVSRHFFKKLVNNGFYNNIRKK